MCRRGCFFVALAMMPAILRASSFSSAALYPMAILNGSGKAYAGDQQAAAPGQIVGNGPSGALLWPAPIGTPIDLNPAGFIATYASATNGIQQVGNGEDGISNYQTHALLWSGSATSAIDLNPVGSDLSSAYGLSATQQVGFADPGGSFHAMLWTGSAASAIDLNPTNLPGFDSEAFATDGQHQVGFGFSSTTGFNSHAILWTNTADSAIDMNPTNLIGFIESEAMGVSGNQQVGNGYGPGTGTNNTPDGYNSHALLWNGSADSAVDLNPVGFTRSFAFGTNGTEQAGYALGDTGISHAFIWFGTAASAFDLQSILPAAGEWNDSHAVNIDAAGNVYGWADGTFNGFTGAFAIEWSPLPEPGPMSLLFVPGLFLRRRQ